MKQTAYLITIFIALAACEEPTQVGQTTQIAKTVQTGQQPHTSLQALGTKKTAPLKHGDAAHSPVVTGTQAPNIIAPSAEVDYSGKIMKHIGNGQYVMVDKNPVKSQPMTPDEASYTIPSPMEPFTKTHEMSPLSLITTPIKAADETQKAWQDMADKLGVEMPPADKRYFLYTPASGSGVHIYVSDADQEEESPWLAAIQADSQEISKGQPRMTWKHSKAHRFLYTGGFKTLDLFIKDTVETLNARGVKTTYPVLLNLTVVTNQHIKKGKNPSIVVWIPIVH